MIIFFVIDYIYSDQQRLIEISNTEGYEKKMKYIERMISEIPTDPLEQYNQFGMDLKITETIAALPLPSLIWAANKTISKYLFQKIFKTLVSFKFLSSLKL